MAVELPKDAEGREIPLDTTTLYTVDGTQCDVSHFTYYPKCKITEQSWHIVFTSGSIKRASRVYLTPPDSWEKLEEDLSNGMFGASPGCAYAGNEAYSCDKCCFESARHCTRRIFTDIRNRIRKLRGEC